MLTAGLVLGLVSSWIQLVTASSNSSLPPCFDKASKTITVGHFPNSPHPFNLLPPLFPSLAGYTVVWQKLDGGGRGIRQLDEGEICASWMGSAPGLYGLSRGAPFRFVALLNLIGASESLVGSIAIKSPKDLKGLTVGTALGSTAHYLLEILLELFEISDQVEVKDVGSRCIDM
jgi:taurine transport system substrate-binding protein